jgi:hypothetical protein
MANDKLSSLSMVPNPAPTPGKGEVPAPGAAKKVILGAGAAGPLAAGGGFWGWVAAHPWESVVIGVAVVIAVGGSLYLLNLWRRRQQEAPVPEMQVVPELVSAGA